MNRIIMSCLVLTLVNFSSSLQGQEKEEDIWAPFRPFLGKWEGTREGFGITADQDTEWKFVLGEKFLQCRSNSIVPEDPHQDLGMLSYDKARERFVYRAFYSEGFVNQYLVTIEDDGKRMVFETEKIENGPPGLRAQLIWTIEGEDGLQVQLCLASGDKPFEVCVTSKLKRVK